ncbi:MAG TPA: hypothetical protein PKA82_13710 [Pyrinomonadaceae bacterium]|nr:hypothetical protein [Pyrinomonadaceae bacterium]
MAINFTFTKTGTSRFAQVIGSGEPKFLVGKETLYDGDKHGLYNTSLTAGGAYDPAAFVGDYGFWAYFIVPTAKGESNNSFTCLNTYDRAKFTFSFMQYAAHVPNGDFVKFFKELLELPSGAFYFPKLVVQNGRIFYRESTGSLTQLENDSSTQALMDYLNPTLNGVENQELICAARMVHWAMKDPANRDLQVKVAVDHFKSNMKRYATSYNLDGYPDKVCQVVCDIRHQGRATSQQIIDALNTGGNFELAFNKLLQLGQPKYASRISTIRTVINKLIADGKFGKKYKLSTNEFV